MIPANHANSKLMMKKYYIYVVLMNIILSVFICTLLDSVGSMTILDKIQTLIFLKIRGQIAPNGNIVIINLPPDRKTDKASNYYEHVESINLLNVISQHAPKVIGIEVLLPELDEDSKHALLELLQKSNNIVLSYSLAHGIYPFSMSYSLLAKKHVKTGYSDTIIDKNGNVIGVVPLIVKKNNLVRERHKSFALAIVELLNKSIKEKDFESKKRYLINFCGPKGTFKTISFKEVIRSAKNKSLKGKIAIVTKTPLSIYNNTPYGPMTTAEIQANIIENMLKNSWIKFNKLYTIIVSTIFGSFLFFHFKKKMNFPLIILVGAYFILTYIFFSVSELMTYGSCVLATILSIYIISKIPWDPWGLVNRSGPHLSINKS